MAIQGNAEILVKPEELERKADDLSEKIRSTEHDFEKLMNIVENTQHYWIGDAGDLNRQLFRNEKSEIEEILNRLKEYPDDLKKIAGIYRDTENKVNEENSQVPTQLIE